MDLSRLLSPQSVAVVGATDRPGTYANTTIVNLRVNGFTGRIVGVHPTHREVEGIACVPTLDEAGAVDAVVIATPAESVPGYVAAAHRLGCGGAVVYAAGFAEGGRPDLQSDLFAAADGLPVIGPNGNGIVSVPARAALWGDAVTLPETAGSIALVSESGNIGVIALAHRGGLGLHTVVSIGNAAVVNSANVLRHLASVEGVGVVALYLEADGDGETWCDALAACAERDVRVVILKSGRSARGAAASASHTAALVGDQAVFRALAHEAGAVMVREPAQLIETARALTRRPRDIRGAAVLACSGADAAIAADVADDVGARLADISAATSDRLRALLPPAATVANPLDHTALVWADTEAIADLAGAMASDEAVGHLVYVQDQPPGLPPGPLAEWVATRAGGVIGAARHGLEAFVVATTPGQESDEAISGLGNALRAIAALQRPCADADRLRLMGRTAVTQADGGVALSETDALSVLADGGITVPRHRAATTAAEAVLAADSLGYPVVLKGVAVGLLHKTEAGAVVVDVPDAEQAHREAGRILATGAVTSLLVEEMVEGGVEIIVTASRAGVIPALTIGLGGIWVEALSDVVVIPLPATAERIHRALADLRGRAILIDRRDGVSLDVEGLCRLAARVGDMLLDREARLIELNPVIVTATQSVAVDAVIVR